jgi:hypothetical protein
MNVVGSALWGALTAEVCVGDSETGYILTPVDDQARQRIGLRIGLAATALSSLLARWRRSFGGCALDRDPRR